MKLINLTKSYGETTIFENFNLEIAEGEILCILGPSGRGKTTLLNILCGICNFMGDTENVPKKTSYVFQEPRLLPNLTVEENLRYVGGKTEDIESVLTQIGLQEKKHHRPNQLSGGEKQRVAIARAFLYDAPLLLLDEPFSSLDTALKIRLSKVFATLWSAYKKTAVFVTHDVEEALMLAHRIIVLDKGKIIADVRTGIEEKSQFPCEYGEDNALRQTLLKILLTEKITDKGVNI